ncbi:MAG: YceI family protein [Anaerolineae bacterium]|nr:YceI family protein [Anaerolineae bacterium]
MTARSRRLLTIVLGIVFALVIVVIAAAIIMVTLLDPGDKGDTSTDLVTPTLAAQTARVFEVSPQESQVDFTANIGGFDLDGVFPVRAGTITLEPVGDELRVLVRLEIHVDALDTGNAAIDRVMRAAMLTGDYPVAFYVATSRELVPVTEDVIYFDLDGELDVRNETDAYSMAVEAQLVSGDMWAVATSELDLANHGVDLPGSTMIDLTARLQAYESDSIVATAESPSE